MKKQVAGERGDERVGIRPMAYMLQWKPPVRQTVKKACRGFIEDSTGFHLDSR
jgi:hypothetical protein